MKQKFIKRLDKGRIITMKGLESESRKKALKFMCPTLSYDEALTHMENAPLSVHHSIICAPIFIKILSDSDDRLRALFPPLHQACKYLHGRTRKFDIRKINIKRARNSFII